MPARVMALDYGRARIGMAVSDPLGLTARPLPALHCKTRSADLKQIQEICEQEEVDRLVLGMPYRMDGSAGEAVREVEEFAAGLRQVVKRPLELEDERLTSKQAHAELKSAGVRHKKRKELVDSTAAVLLLRSYLARQKDSLERPSDPDAS